MISKLDIPWDLRDALIAQMPPYIKGKLDQQASARLNIAIVAGIFLVFVLPTLLSYTSVGRWLTEYEVAGLAIMAALIFTAYWLIDKWPNVCQQKSIDKILRLRISTRQWPDVDRNYREHFSAITEETIAEAESEIASQIEIERDLLPSFSPVVSRGSQGYISA